MFQYHILCHEINSDPQYNPAFADATNVFGIVQIVSFFKFKARRYVTNLALFTATVYFAPTN